MNTKEFWQIKGARLLDPASGTDRVGDLFAANGRFVETLPPGADVFEVNGEGMIALPGPIDLHVHFREPGGEQSETIVTGSSAAFKGGIATLVTMPNTLPPVDTPEAVRYQAQAPLFPIGGLRILPSACCTRGRAGREPADLAALAAAGAVAFTDDGSMVDDAEVMETVMRRAAALGKVVMEHAVVPSIAGAGVIRDCPAARQLGLAIFPPEAEVDAVARDIDLCRRTGCALHVQHLSCAGSVELIRAAQREGLPVTAEATPHHLMLAAEDIPGDDANWKMNPPLGTRQDVEVLRQAVLEGVIRCFATDHAPHAPALKAKGFAAAPFGVIGLETALPATWTAMVEACGMAPLEWARRWICGPAAVLGIPAPSFAIGAPACAAMVYPESWTFGEEDIVSKSRNSPFVGRTFGLSVLGLLR
ncbi:MAG: dihydroorotase [Kiritimatiellia bacterium]